MHAVVAFEKRPDGNGNPSTEKPVAKDLAHACELADSYDADLNDFSMDKIWSTQGRLATALTWQSDLATGITAAP